MADEHDLLEHARRRAPSTDLTFLDLERRRDRRVRAKRFEAGVAAITIAALVLGGTFLALRERSGTGPVGGGDPGGATLPPATQPPAEAGPGQYYFAKTWSRSPTVCSDVSGCEYRTTEALTWWSTDESGRISTDAVDERYPPGGFPHDTITTGLPTDPTVLREAMFDRSAPAGESPEPQTTVSPGQDGMDASVEQSIVNLLAMPNATPALRAALLEVLAGMPDVTLELSATDPVGRPAYLVLVTTFGGPTVNRLYVDPATHELLARVAASPDGGEVWETWILEEAGIADGVDSAPGTSVVLAPISDPSPGDLPPASAEGLPVPVPEESSCSQGGPDLTLTLRDGRYDARCFVVETGSAFTLTFTIADAGRTGQLVIFDASSHRRVFLGEPLTGPGSITYRVPALDHGTYMVVNKARPRALVGRLDAS
jgi:hypothetical protein